MELQAGKRYIKGNGEVSGVLEETGYSIFTFRDPKSGLTYTAKGNLILSNSTRFDLVAEYIESN